MAIFEQIKNISSDHLSKIKRAGIVVYTWKRSRCYFGLGIDKRSGDISDFGGYRKRTDLNCLVTALREFEEESLGIYGEFTTEQLEQCYGLCDDITLMIFLRVNIDPRFAIKLYKNAVIKEPAPEMSRIIWLDINNFLKLISKDHPKYILYSRIRDILIEKITQISDILVKPCNLKRSKSECDWTVKTVRT